MNHYEFPHRFRVIYEKAVATYKEGKRGPDTFFTAEEKAFLAANGMTPQHVYEEFVRVRVRNSGRLMFRDLFTPPYRRARLIGLFLAVLELIKNRELGLEQPDSFGEIWLVGLAEPVS